MVNRCGRSTEPSLSTHDRTTFVMSEPTASAIVVRFIGSPVATAVGWASTTALVCGVR